MYILHLKEHHITTMKYEMVALLGLVQKPLLFIRFIVKGLNLVTLPFFQNILYLIPLCNSPKFYLKVIRYFCKINS